MGQSHIHGLKKEEGDLWWVAGVGFMGDNWVDLMSPSGEREGKGRRRRGTLWSSVREERGRRRKKDMALERERERERGERERKRKNNLCPLNLHTHRVVKKLAVKD